MMTNTSMKTPLDWEPETMDADRPETEEEALEARQEEMRAFIHGLRVEAERRVERREPIERRWLKDLRQYHGFYDDDVLAAIKENEGSEAFINLTAVKTDALEARLWDLLFPTDDRNWGIKPTPVPELTDEAEAAMRKADEARARADVAEQEMQQAATEGNSAAATGYEDQLRAAEDEEDEASVAAELLHAQILEATRRSDLMTEEIEDQLQTCGFPAEARDMISNACKIGFGVIKGPVLGERQKRRWQKTAAAPGADDAPNPTADFYELTQQEGTMPAAYCIDPWTFFPDPDTTRVEDGEGAYERHLLSRTKMRKLARRPGMNADAFRALLKDNSRDAAPWFMQDLSVMTGQSNGDLSSMYTVWEYTGPLEPEDLRMLAEDMQRRDVLEALGEEVDPLQEINAKVWFCEGKVLSFALHPLDSGDMIYSTFTIRRDEIGPFGFGVPWIMRHPQAIINGAYRMMLDNAGLSTGPQILADKDAVEPEDGDWKMKPRKVWLYTKHGLESTRQPFATFDIPSRQQEIAGIIAMASGAIDEVTAMPAIAQGEQGSGVTKTAQGMALLMNSANVSFRRIVKTFDDDVSVPLIRRFYDFNMQFSKKPEIKGDYDVIARGSSVLLVREMQAQNLVMIANMFGDHPIYGPMLKHGDLLKQIFRAHMLSSDEVLRSPRELEDYLKKMQQGQTDAAAEAQNAANQLKQAELELKREEMGQKVELSNMEWDKRERIAQLGHEMAMTKLAESLNMTRDTLEARAGIERERIDSSERKLATEAAVKERTGDSAGGSI